MCPRFKKNKDVSRKYVTGFDTFLGHALMIRKTDSGMSVTSVP